MSWSSTENTTASRYIRHNAIHYDTLRYERVNECSHAQDSRQYMVDMRNALKFPGMLSVFFEWSTFRIVLFVDSAELDRDLVFATLRGQQFVNRFGDFNTENITEIVVNDG